MKRRDSKERNGYTKARNIAKEKAYNAYVRSGPNDTAKKWFDRPAYGMSEKKEEKQDE